MAMKVGIIRLGKISGKTKYALVDEDDISLAEMYAFEARLEVDKDGNGCQLTAYAFKGGKRSCQPWTLHDLIWCTHKGSVGRGHQVAHKNGIRMDNRLDNLCLLLHGKTIEPSEEEHDSSVKGIGGDRSLYYAAMNQIPIDPVEESSLSHKRCYTADGELIEDEDNDMYYECHYPPCCRLEQELREFSICGRCQQVRYCSVQCQQRDWPVHKRFCREPVVPRFFKPSYDSSPER